MDYKEITDLIKLINKSDLSEFKMENGDFKLSIRTNTFSNKATQVIQTAAPAPMMAAMPAAEAPAAANPAPAAPATSAAPAPKAEADSANLLEIKSPIVGTFYRSSSPDKPPFLKVGDTVAKGDTVCIVEAMKLFNEIESEVSGTVVKVLIEDAAPVEYDQVLFLVDPS